MKKNIFLLLIATMCVLLSACREKAPVRNCEIKSLLLDIDYLHVGPSDITDYNFGSPLAEAPPESAGYSFHLSTDTPATLVQHAIYRYRFIDDAIAMFNGRERYLFRQDSDSGPWETPIGLLLVEIHADQYRAACGIRYLEKKCDFVARYVEYYVFFQVAISENGLNEGDFSDGVKQIDSQMMACVGT